MEEKSLAMEMLEELRSANKRNFIIIIVLIVMLVASNAGWLIYESQYNYEYGDEVTYSQDIKDIESSDISQTIN